MEEISKSVLQKILEEHLTPEMVEKAEAEFRAAPQDNSPQLDMLCFREIVEQVTALNLGNLKHEMEAVSNEFPVLIEATKTAEVTHISRGELMAIGFEAGRRYNLLQVFQLLSEEVEALPAEANKTENLPLLEM
jgi:hypothetical protein